MGTRDITLIVGIVVAIIMAFLSPLIGPLFESFWAKIRGKRKIVRDKDIPKACLKIYEDALRERFSPDYILGIDGGGCVVAAYLEQLFNKPMLEFAADRSNPKDPRFPRDRDFFEKLKPVITGKEVLLVDDLSNESRTLQRAKDLLEEIVEDLRIAVISKPCLKLARNRNQDLTLYNYFPRRDSSSSSTEGMYDHNGKCTVHFPWEVWIDP